MKQFSLTHHRLYRNDKGATAIEFAIVLVPLLAILSGIIEFSLLYFATTVIENSTTIGARLGITGSTYAGEPRVVSGADRVEMIRNNIIDQSNGLLQEDKISITCQSLGNDFTGVPEEAYGNYTCGAAIDNQESCNNAGQGGNVVIYTVSYCWKTLTPLGVYLGLMTGQPFNNNSDEVLLTSSLIVRNERFD